MTGYRARDLLLVPGILSLLRVPLAAVFPFVVDRAPLAVLVIALAGITDVVDGWWARKFHQVTPIGTVIDPLSDKAFVASVVITLVAAGRLPWVGALFLASREIGEIPLLIGLAAHHARHPRRSERLGKLTTVSQIATVTSALVLTPWTPALTLLTGVIGLAAAVRYWGREVTSWERPADAP